MERSSTLAKLVLLRTTFLFQKIFRMLSWLLWKKREDICSLLCSVAFWLSVYNPRYAKFYPDSPAKPAVFSRLVSPQAFTRVSTLLKNTKGTIVLGGETDEETKYVSPTVVKDVKPDDSLMSELRISNYPTIDYSNTFRM